MKITKDSKKYSFSKGQVSIKRNEHGVPIVDATNTQSMAYAQGLCHGLDRGMQMVFTRIICQGRASEILDDTEELLKTDIYMRELGIYQQSKKELSRLPSSTLTFLEFYSEGINKALSESLNPVFKLIKYKPEPWQPVDTLATMRIMAYIGLAQTQQTMEKFIIESIKNGVDSEGLRTFLFPHLNEWKEDDQELLKKTNLYWTSLPEIPFVPVMKNSNNWSLTKDKTKSGSAIHCNDPHLEANRLPAVWYEMILKTNNNYLMGISMPGVPGMAMGRSQKVGFGFTYGFMDTIDYFIEDLKDGTYLSDQFQHTLNKRTEVIKRKKSNDFVWEIFETENGVIERDPFKPLTNGLYLSRAWSAYQFDTHTTIDALMKLPFTQDAKQAAKECQKVFISCNWVLSDIEGNVIYQQSGHLPNRSHSGLYPLPGWDSNNAWSGLQDKEDLSFLENPPEGFIATANDDWNQKGKPLSINLPMGSYRAERIRQLLSDKEKYDVIDMKAIQSDLYSIQAEKFLTRFKKFIPNTPTGKILSEWDLRYNKESKGAFIFEEVYRELLALFFEENILGRKEWDHIFDETCLFTDFYHLFDRPFLDDHSNQWDYFFRRKTRDEYYKQAINNTMKCWPSSKVKTWGDVNRFTMKHLLLGDVKPFSYLLNKGPYALEGNRATIVQGQVYRTGGRDSTFCPSWRFISDLSSDHGFSILAGGPSENPFSRYYSNEVKRWLNFQYKIMGP
tara:strand:- start:7750 stop:9939 length:2190 start_codon:yes stop_codon:yes gene_type:complete